MSQVLAPADPQSESNHPARRPTGSGTADPYAREPQGGVPWVRYFDALKRHLLFIVVVALCGSAAGLVVAKRIKPVYHAQSTVWINESNGPGSGPIRAAELLPSTSWVELLRSFAIIDPVVQRLKLNVFYKTPGDSVVFRDFASSADFHPGSYLLTVSPDGHSYRLARADSVTMEQGLVGDSIGRGLGFAWQPSSALLTPGRSIQFAVVTPRSASLRLLARLHTDLPEGGQFLTIALSGSDAAVTARTLNAWTEQFVNSATELKKRHLVEFRKTLGDQLSLAESTLHQSEIALEQFRVNTITLPSDNTPLAGGVQATRDPVFTNYFQQKEALDAVRSDRSALERMISDAKGGPLNTQAFLGLPSILNNTPQLRSAIEELSSRQAALRTEQQYLTDANPRIKQLREAIRVLEFETIPNIAESTLVSLRVREQELGTRIADQSVQLRAIPSRTIEEMRLVRQVTASENVYNALKARYEEVSLSEAETTPDVTILDRAVAPLLPTSDDAPRILLIAIIASLAAAIGIALLHDRLDPRFRYPEQATHDLGLSVSGTVPRFKMARGGVMDVASMSQVVESFRTLRLAIRYDFPQGQPIVLSISSPGPGDGKSLVSSNLALAFASAGQRTLLIDGDVRRGNLHATFDVPAAPGLVDFLRGDVDADNAVRPTSTANLFLLPGGKRHHRAPELLASERMSELVRAMQEEFDVIVIDSPPFVAGMDAYALGAAAGSMLVVLRPSITDRKLAAAKLDVIDRLPIRLLGAVLNSVGSDGIYRYYGTDYGYRVNARLPRLNGTVATPKGLVLSA